jgi:hypothetical protein
MAGDWRLNSQWMSGHSAQDPQKLNLVGGTWCSRWGDRKVAAWECRVVQAGANPAPDNRLATGRISKEPDGARRYVLQVAEADVPDRRRLRRGSDERVATGGVNAARYEKLYQTAAAICRSRRPQGDDHDGQQSGNLTGNL